jgi:hypothetical protein
VGSKVTKGDLNPIGCKENQTPVLRPEAKKQGLDRWLENQIGPGGKKNKHEQSPYLAGAEDQHGIGLPGDGKTKLSEPNKNESSTTMKIKKFLHKNE